MREFTDGSTAIVRGALDAGCGHHSILDQLSAALMSLELDPHKVVLVSDIGCSGLSDQYFVTSAFHGLRGRSITYASGIKLARALKALDVFPIEALEAAASLQPSRHAKDNADTIRAAVTID